MTDAETIASAAERTADSLFKFADGEIMGALGEPCAPELQQTVGQIAGAFRHFAALIRIGIAENREPLYPPVGGVQG